MLLPSAQPDILAYRCVPLFSETLEDGMAERERERERARSSLPQSGVPPKPTLNKQIGGRAGQAPAGRTA